MAMENDDLRNKVGLVQVIASHSLAVRERFPKVANRSSLKETGCKVCAQTCSDTSQT